MLKFSSSRFAGILALAMLCSVPLLSGCHNDCCGDPAPCCAAGQSASVDMVKTTPTSTAVAPSAAVVPSANR